MKELLAGTVLYENATGTTGNVTLSQDISNMKRIRISGYHNYAEILCYFSQEFDVLVNTEAGLLVKSQDRSVNSYIAGETIIIGATSITRGTAYVYNLTTPGRSESSLNITKVIGYNY